MIYRGDGLPPEFEHDDRVLIGGDFGVIQHRRQDHLGWEYGVLTEGPGILWILWTRTPIRVDETCEIVTMKHVSS